VIPAAAAAVFDFAGKVVGLNNLVDTTGSIITSQLETYKILAAQKEHRKNPVLFPGVEALVTAFRKGWFNVDKNGNDVSRQNLNYYLYAMRSQGAMRGESDKTSLDDVQIAHLQEAWDAVYNSTAVKPGIRESFMGYISGMTDREQFDRMLLRNGAEYEDWAWLYPLLCNRLSMPEIMEIYKRGYLSEKQFNEYLKTIQYGVSTDWDKIRELTKVIPGYQDIVRFVIRDVFNPALVKFLHLDDELEQNTDYLAWCNAQGLGPVTIITPEGKPVTADFAKLYWYAHWVQPPPGMAGRFLHRFYGKSRYGPSPYLSFDKPFEIDDFKTLMRSQDYSPKWRGYLAGMNYNPYTRRDLVRLRTKNLISKADCYHSLRATGYADKEADSLTNLVDILADEAANKTLRDKTKSKMCEAYQLGSIDKDTFIQKMTQVGIPTNEVQVEAEVCDMEAANKYLTEFIRSVKAGLMSGAYDVNEARLELTSLQLDKDKIEQYLGLWQVILRTRRKLVAAGEVSKWFVDGLIGIDELISRLTKLDYNAEDVTRIVQAAVLSAAKVMAKAQKAASREAQRIIEDNLRKAEKIRKAAQHELQDRQRAATRAANEAKHEADKRLREFLSGRSEVHLKKYWKDGEIDVNEIRDTLKLKGWADIDINRWIESYKPK
jgi:hypothetical protein